MMADIDARIHVAGRDHENRLRELVRRVRCLPGSVGSTMKHDLFNFQLQAAPR